MLARAPIGARQPPPDALRKARSDSTARRAGRSSIAASSASIRPSAWRIWMAIAPWPRPGQVRGDVETRVLRGRNVLRTVNRDVNAAGEEGPLDRGDERALAPRSVGGPSIAFGLDDDDPARLADLIKRVVNESGLGERQ